MSNAIYSEEDRARLTYELGMFSNGFVFFVLGQLILAFVRSCSLATWFYGIMALLLIYWSVKVFRKLETSNKVIFCLFYGALVALIYLSYRVSPICN